MLIQRLGGAVAALALVSTAAMAQPAPGAGGAPPGPPPRGAFVFPPVKPNGPMAPADHIKVHGQSLVGNLEGDPVDRDVEVILPPSYAKSPHRRYPVIYLLHGYMITGQYFADFIHAREAVLAEAKKGHEFIVVVPDTDTKMCGSMYSSSPTTGDFEAFVAKDLVAYIDSHYRTIAKRSSRGLAGHSMGGYGVWKIGMKYPGPWAAIYAENACCVSPRVESVEEAKKLSEVPFAESGKADFGTRAGLASAVAWSPDPKNPPYYADFAYKDGAVDPLVLARFAANSPLSMVPQYIPALKSFTAIGVGAGDKDGLLKDDTAIHDELDRFGVANEFTVYHGGHADKIAEQFTETVLPFFAKHLVMKAK